MDKYELGRMARESGVNCGPKTVDKLEVFARLVANAERESCANKVRQNAHMFATNEACESLVRSVLD